MLSGKIKTLNNLKKSDYTKGVTKNVSYKIREDLLADLDLSGEEVDNLFISEEEYELLP